MATALSAIALMALAHTGEAMGAAANTEVSFGGILYNATTAKTEFSGTVSSPRRDCAKDRKITVFRQVPGPDPKFGAKKATKNGGLYRWLITSAGVAPDGDYYAKAEAGDSCKGDRSQTVQWDG